MQEAASKSLMYKLEVLIVHNSQELRITDFFCFWPVCDLQRILVICVKDTKLQRYSATEHLPLHNSL